MDGAGARHPEQRADELQILVLGDAVRDLERRAKFAEVGFFRWRFSEAREVAVGDAANGAGQVEADDGAVRKSEAGLAVEALDELELARAVGGELQADLGVAGDPLEIRGILQERQRRNAVEIEVRRRCWRCPAGAVDGQNALAVSLIKLNVVERRLHRFVLDGDGDGRLADRNVLELEACRRRAAHRRRRRRAA